MTMAGRKAACKGIAGASWQAWLASLAGITVAVLGMCVITGWLTHNVRLIQIDAAYVPMQFNTALAFLLGGMGLLALQCGQLRMAQLIGWLLLALGSLTLLQYLSASDFGLDQLFMRSYITLKTSHPGRMAPNTALCVTVHACGLLLCTRAAGHRWESIGTGVTGTLLLCLGTVAFAGYLMGVETAFGWGALTRMAVHTALGFMVLSLGWLLRSWQLNRQSPAILINRLSIPVAIAVLTVTILLWQQLHRERVENFAYQSHYLDLLLIFGTSLAVAMAWAINRAHAVQVQANDLRHTQLALQQDISEREQAQAALRESEQRFRSLFENAAVGIAQISLQGRYLKINEAYCRIIGYTQQEVLQQQLSFQQITHADDLQEDEGMSAKLLQSEQESYTLEKRYLCKDGSTAWVNLSVFLLRDTHKAPMYFITAAQDITERKALQGEIQRQAQMDHLTGLSNRRHFMQMGEAELARAMRYQCELSLLMVDVDHFKGINDTHGHRAGDLVLQQLSLIFLHTLREIDCVGRLGGEEFAMLLPETGLPMAVEVAERLRERVAVHRVMLEDGAYVQCSVSIGVAMLQAGDDSIDALLGQADGALYQAKHGGRNRVCMAAQPLKASGKL